MNKDMLIENTKYFFITFTKLVWLLFILITVIGIILVPVFFVGVFLALHKENSVFESIIPIILFVGLFFLAIIFIKNIKFYIKQANLYKSNTIKSIILSTLFIVSCTFIFVLASRVVTEGINTDFGLFEGGPFHDSGESNIKYNILISLASLVLFLWGSFYAFKKKLWGLSINKKNTTLMLALYFIFLFLLYKQGGYMVSSGSWLESDWRNILAPFSDAFPFLILTTVLISLFLILNTYFYSKREVSEKALLVKNDINLSFGNIESKTTNLLISVKNNTRIFLEGKILYPVTILFTIFSVYFFTLPFPAGTIIHILIVILLPILIILSTIKLERDFSSKYNWLKLIHIIPILLVSLISIEFFPRFFGRPLVDNIEMFDILFTIFLLGMIGWISINLIKNFRNLTIPNNIIKAIFITFFLIILITLLIFWIQSVRGPITI